MARSKENIRYATSQARLEDDEAVRTAYKHGTPLEGGKIAESEPVDLFSSAHNIPRAHPRDEDSSNNQSQMQQQQQPNLTKREGGPESAADSAKFPKKTPPAPSTK